MRASPILCIAPRWLGDSVLARPALAALGGAGVELHVLARSGLGRVLEDLPGVRAVHLAEPGRLPRFRAAARLRSQRFAAALVLSPSFSSALAAWLAGAPVRVGFASDARRGLLTHPLPLPERGTHLSVHYLALAQELLAALREPVERLALPSAGGLPEMPLLVPHAHETAAAVQRLGQAGLGPRPYLVLAPGARFGPAKRWPADRFAAAGRLLAAATGAALVLVGEPADAVATHAVHAAVPAAIDLTGLTHLDALVGVLAAARGVLANDSGIMHLAAALGRPVVGIFGSSNPAWTRPLGPRATAMLHAVGCSPCYRSRCNRDFGCMLGLAPEAVAAQLLARLDNGLPADTAGAAS